MTAEERSIKAWTDYKLALAKVQADQEEIKRLIKGGPRA